MEKRCSNSIIISKSWIKNTFGKNVLLFSLSLPCIFVFYSILPFHYNSEFYRSVIKSFIFDVSFSWVLVRTLLLLLPPSSSKQFFQDIYPNFTDDSKLTKNNKDISEETVIDETDFVTYPMALHF